MIRPSTKTVCTYDSQIDAFWQLRLWKKFFFSFTKGLLIPKKVKLKEVKKKNIKKITTEDKKSYLPNRMPDT